jgi:hypothetical protein
MKKKVEHSLSIKARETRKEKRREHVVRTPRGKEESKSTAVSLFLYLLFRPPQVTTQKVKKTHTHTKKQKHHRWHNSPYGLR